MHTLEILWLGLAIVTPFFMFLMIVVMAAIQASKGTSFPSWQTSEKSPPFFVFLVPAHDEERGIGRTVQSLLAHDYPKDRFCVWVVADNCADQTASEAALHGAHVVQRRNPERKGKGYALAFGVDALFRSSVPWDAVVIIDADTRVGPGLLLHFSSHLAEGVDWQQGYYTVSNSNLSWRTQLLTFAFALFNGVWPLGLDGIGLGAPLRGNGMAFSRRGLVRQSLRAFGLAEDLEFSWRLRLAGEKVRFVPKARVLGAMVSRGGPGALAQRLRWEHGRRALRREFRSSIWHATCLSPRAKGAAFMDLYFPPLAKLGGLLLLMISAAAYNRAFAALSVAIAYAAILGAYLISPVFLMDLPIRYLTSVAHAPRYALWKLRLLLRPRPREWVRTARE